MKTNKFFLYLTPAFLLAEILLYGLFLAHDLGGAHIGNATAVKYATVLLALAFAATGFLTSAGKPGAIRDTAFLTAGLVFTAISDWFLLVRGDHFEFGLVTFLCAQTCYAVRVRLAGRLTQKLSRVFLLLRVLLPLLLIALLPLLGLFSLLNALVAVYFVQLIFNLVENAVSAALPGAPEERFRPLLLAIGFLFFIGCDICVGLSNLAHGLGGSLIWLFYTPSQVLISLSSIRKEPHRYENTAD